jgi:hypothetical protein
MPRTERPYLRILILLLMAVVAALAAYLTMAQRMADPDQFWHIATGRWIVEHGTVPTMDVFSWWGIANGRAWVAQSWLFGLLIYGVYSLGGFIAVYWAAGILEALTVFVVYAFARARRVDPLVALLVTAASMFGTMFFVAPRPQMLSFVLVPLTALLLEKRKWPWALAVLVLGVNVHGGIWPLYLLVFAFYEFPRRWWVIALALALVGVNPNPVNTFLYPLKGLLSSSEPVINEFMPTVLWTRKGDLAMYVALILLTRRKRIPWKDGLFALAFVLLSLSAIRHVQWFYLVVLPILAPYISLSFDPTALRLPRRLVDRLPARLVALLSGSDTTAAASAAEDAALTADEAPEQADGDTPRGLLGRAGLRRLELVLVVALAVASLLLAGAVSRQKLDVDRWYPKDMIAFLKLHEAKRLFNVWHEGGYLIFNGIQPLIDGRGDPYAAQKPGQQDLSLDYMRATRLNVDPVPLLEKLKVDYVLVPSSALMMVLDRDPRFELVKTDDYHALFRFLPDRKSVVSTGSALPTLP